MIKGARVFLETGKLPEGHEDLGETVAEYGNIILGTPNYNASNLRSTCYKQALRVFNQHGPDFLKILARISPKEAIHLSIINPN